MDKFYITSHTKLIWNCNITKVLEKAEKRWERDIEWTISGKESGNNIMVSLDAGLEKETFCWEIKNENLWLRAADELGILYALFYISETYLGIKPLWFWNDQKFVKKEKVEITKEQYTSENFAVLYRGWSFRDVLLITMWNIGDNSMYVWEMVMEALLRLGGNTIAVQIDDKEEEIYGLAEEMGLWTVRSKETIKSIKNQKIIWNLGSLEEIQNFSRKKNGLEYLARKETKEIDIRQINQTVKVQYNEIRELTKQKNPIVMIKVYEKILQENLNDILDIPKEIIKVWTDNGYGKMVWEEKEEDKEKDIELPNLEPILRGRNGLYYHLSASNLEAGSYLTMLSNPPEFIADELTEAFAKGADKLLIVNASNIKPHVYFLDFIARLWRYGTVEANIDSQEYIKNYYPENWKRVYGIVKSYHRYMLYYGSEKEKRVGEQFYHSMLRGLLHGWLKNNGTKTEDSIKWATNKKRGLKSQFEWLEETLLEGIEGLWLVYQKCYNLYEELTEKESEEGQLFYDSIYLQTIIHYFSAKGTLEFCYAFKYYLNQKYPEAFAVIGKSIELFEFILDSIKKAEHDKWEGFYETDCFTDIKLTIYCLKNIGGFIRNIGEGPHFQKWERKFLILEKEDNSLLKKKVYFTDEELYQVIKDKVYLKEKIPIEEIN